MNKKNELLTIKDLHVSYGSEKALNGLNLKIYPDSICAFIGSNGAGKTTTFSTIANFIYPDKGDILINNQLLKLYRKQGGLIGLLPQDVSFYNDRTIESQLTFLAKLSGVAKGKLKEEVKWALDVVGLTDKKALHPLQLSHGMKVRLGIAQAILGHPELVLLDEPTAGLDPLRREQFYQLITELQGTTSFIISSHQLGELETLCNHICIIEEGKLVISDSMQNFLANDQHIFFQTSTKTNVFKNKIIQAFPQLRFDFSSNQTDFHVFTKEALNNLQAINQSIISWLLNNDIDIIKLSQKSSLTAKYLQQLQK